MRIRHALFAAAFLPLLGGAAFATGPDFNLINKTGFQINELQISQHGENRWGPDILRANALGDAQQTKITFPRNNGVCMFDMRVKYSDGNTAEWGNINLCEFVTVSLLWDASTHATRAIGE